MSLERPGRSEGGIDHLERHDLGQLAQVPGREHARSARITFWDKGRFGNNMINRQRSSRGSGSSLVVVTLIRAPLHLRADTPTQDLDLHRPALS